MRTIVFSMTFQFLDFANPANPDLSRICLRPPANSMIADAYWWCRGCGGTTCRGPTAALRPRSFMNSHDPDLRSVPFGYEKGGLRRQFVWFHFGILCV